jgi:hypothetical protein
VLFFCSVPDTTRNNDDNVMFYVMILIITVIKSTNFLKDIQIISSYNKDIHTCFQSGHTCFQYPDAEREVNIFESLP